MALRLGAYTACLHDRPLEAALDVLDYQWDVAAEFWTGIDALARASGVRVAIEMHPHNLAQS